MRNKKFLSDIRACSPVRLSYAKYNPFARNISHSQPQEYHLSPLDDTLDSDLNWLQQNPSKLYRFRFLTTLEREYFIESDSTAPTMSFLFIARPDPNRDGLFYKLFSQIPEHLSFTG